MLHLLYLCRKIYLRYAFASIFATVLGVRYREDENTLFVQDVNVLVGMDRKGIFASAAVWFSVALCHSCSQKLCHQKDRVETQRGLRLEGGLLGH